MLAALAAAGTLTLGACQAGTSAQAPTPPLGPSRSHAPSPSATPGDIRLLDAKGAEFAVHWVGAPAAPATAGSDYAVVSTLTQPKDCGQQLVAGVLLPGVSWFVGIRPAALCAWQGESTLPVSYGVGILPSGKQTVTPWPSTASLVRGDKPRQVTNSTTDGQTVVWSETASTDLYHDNWRVFAAAIADGTPHLVARAEELTGGKALPFYESTYAINAGRVFWSSSPPAGASTAPDAGVPQVISKDLTGQGAITVVAKDADEPVTTDRGVVVRTITMTNAIGQDAYGKAQARQTMSATGIALVTSSGLRPLVTITSDAPLPFGVHVDALAGSGSHVAFAVGTTEYVLDLHTNQLTGFRVHGIEYPVQGADDTVVTAPVVVHSSAASANLLAWSYGNGAPTGPEPVFVYQFASGTLQQADVPLNAGTVWANGDDVAWSASDGTWGFETATSWTG